MRKITDEAAEAFKQGTPYKNSNTMVLGDYNHTVLTLHDNVIATIERDDDGNGKLLLTDSGWKTNTTKERLNGVLIAFFSAWRIYQLKGVWYYTDGAGIRKEWQAVNEFEV